MKMKRIICLIVVLVIVAYGSSLAQTCRVGEDPGFWGPDGVLCTCQNCTCTKVKCYGKSCKFSDGSWTCTPDNQQLPPDYEGGS